MHSKKPEMGISLSYFYCDMQYMHFKLCSVQMVTLKPFCMLDSSVATTFRSVHIIYVFAMLVLKSRKRIYLFGSTKLRLFVHHITYEDGAFNQLKEKITEISHVDIYHQVTVV